MIDFKLLNEALAFYQTWDDFKQIDVPWIVPLAATGVTRPDDVSNMEVISAPVGKMKFPGERSGNHWGCLVASGEQGFIEMMRTGELKPGRYVTLTPCFRPETELSEIKQLYFMKVELIDFGPHVGPRELELILNVAELFMAKRLPIVRLRTGEYEYDLNSKSTNVELGSYGVREEHGYRWVYGTGLAEPRFSTVLSMERS